MRRLVLTLVLLAAPAAARANGVGLPDTFSVALRPGNTDEVGLEANFGWITSEGGAAPTWVCHESVLEPTSALTPYYYLGEDVTYVTVRSLGVSLDPTFSMFRSADGCDWDPPADLENVVVREITFDPVNPDHHLLATFTGSGATNGIWETDDAGITWHKTDLDLADRFFRTVKFSAADPNRVYATATWFQPQPQAWVYVSDDGGDQWTEIPWVFTVDSTLQNNVDVIATSPSDADIAYIRTSGGTDYVLRTTDGGMSWAPVFSLMDDDVRTVEYHAVTGDVWIGSVFQGTWTSPDGVDFTPLSDPPATRDLSSDPRGMFVAANNYEDGLAVGLAASGTAFQGLYQFIDLAGTRDCPAGSDVAVICEPLWPALAQRLGITTPTPTPTPPSGDDDDDGGPGCSCALAVASPAPFAPIAAGFLLLALQALRRKRA